MDRHLYGPKNIPLFTLHQQKAPYGLLYWCHILFLKLCRALFQRSRSLWYFGCKGLPLLETWIKLSCKHSACCYDIIAGLFMLWILCNEVCMQSPLFLDWKYFDLWIMANIFSLGICCHRNYLEGSGAERRAQGEGAQGRDQRNKRTTQKANPPK